MTIETRTITVRAFRDPDGKPTCYTPIGHCRFFGSRRLGGVVMCLEEYVDLIRRDNGYTQPCDGCPVWNTPELRQDGSDTA